MSLVSSFSFRCIVGLGSRPRVQGVICLGTPHGRPGGSPSTQALENLFGKKFTEGVTENTERVRHKRRSRLA